MREDEGYAQYQQEQAWGEEQAYLEAESARAEAEAEALAQEEEEMKTTATCPKCGNEIGHLIYSCISEQEVSLRYIKGDNYVLGDNLIYGDSEPDSDSAYFKCPLCDEGVCSTAETALEFLKGE